MKLVVAILTTIVAIGVIGVLWFMLNKEPSASAPEQSEQTTTTAETETDTSDRQDENDSTATEVIITYTDTGFRASESSIPAGSTIRVVNESSSPLQFSSDPHPQHTDNSELNLSVLQPGEQATMTVQEPGMWGFHNHLNDGHTGSITITN